MSDSNPGQNKVGAETASQLSVSVSKNDGVAVLGLSGSLLSSEITSFRRACNNIGKSGLNRYVVDLGEVEEIDGYGLASLVGLLSRSRSEGGRLVLCGINPDLRQRFEATHCDMIFDTATTVANALDKLTKEDNS